MIYDLGFTILIKALKGANAVGTSTLKGKGDVLITTFCNPNY